MRKRRQKVKHGKHARRSSRDRSLSATTAGFFGSGGSKKQPTVSKWLSRTLKEEKERKKETAFKLWLACHTQEEIAAAVDMTRQAIAVWEDEFAKKLEVDIFANSPDFDPPLYNVWKQQTKTAGVNRP